ncbi:phosphotransferase family protein [Pseudonocardia sichuanensis]
MAEVATGSHETTIPFTAETARQTLTQACQQVGIEAHPVELIRMGSNAVFRIGENLIARVAPSVGLLPNAEKQIEIARWLQSVGYPATRAADIDQPIETADRVVTFWESVSLQTTYAPIREVAELIKRLHELPAPDHISLPELRPFGDAQDELPQFVGLPPADAEYLRKRVEWARETFPVLPFALPRGHIHGDANVGNVLCDDHGSPVLIDLDSFAVGAREWDLIQTALFFDRLGWHTEKEYREFVEVYGYDITEWSAYSDLADMREIAMTSWIANKADSSPESVVEAVKRIEAIRSGASRRDWGAY